jgi:serine/threonine-protein kinase HipA
VAPDRCFFCCEELEAGAGLYHSRCSSRFFGEAEPPELPYSWDDLNPLAERVIRSRISVPGVQPKLSLHLDRAENRGGRLTLVGLWGDYVLKPPHVDFPGMPELEHACMRMARSCGMDTVPFTLIPLKSGETAYLCRRVDRDGDGKLHMEDMAQLSGKMTEQKYRGSMEQVGKAVWAYSSTPLLDVVRLFELTAFSFLTANSDMHLKNFSLLYGRDGRIRLSPAYDLLATQVLVPEDTEESALPINGKKAGLSGRDFRMFAERLRLTPKQHDNVLVRLRTALGKMSDELSKSFAHESHKEELQRIITERAGRIGIAGRP